MRLSSVKSKKVLCAEEKLIRAQLQGLPLVRNIIVVLGPFSHSVLYPDTLSLTKRKLTEIHYRIAEGWSVSVAARVPL